MEITQTIGKPVIVDIRYDILKRWNPPRGIDTTVIKIAENSQECIMQLFADTANTNPEERKTRQDVERVLERFSNKIVADRIKSRSMFKKFNIKDCNIQHTIIYENNNNADK